jgi:hypothetical protein
LSTLSNEALLVLTRRRQEGGIEEGGIIDRGIGEKGFEGVFFFKAKTKKHLKISVT